jgi:hypothetical protein
VCNRIWRVAPIWLVLAAAVSLVALSAESASGGTTLDGTGSSIAAFAITQWDAEVSHAPYSLGINYSAVNSGQGLY